MIAAWAYGAQPSEIPNLLEPFPGLGAVLYNHQYQAATGFPAIAYVNSTAHARHLTECIRAGCEFKAAIIMDERNHDGPSGAYLTPREYREHYREITAELPPGLLVSTMGLAPVGGFWRNLLWSLAFDREYARQLPDSDLRALNPNKMRSSMTLRVLAESERPMVLSPAPFNRWPDSWLQPIKLRTWLQLAQRSDVLAVCLWSLVQHADQPHGLYRPDKKTLTPLGRNLKEAMRNAASRNIGTT